MSAHGGGFGLGAFGFRADFVSWGDGSIEEPNQRDASCACVLHRSPLEAVGREEHALKGSCRPEFIGQHLHLGPLNRPGVVFALNKYYEVDSELTETRDHVNAEGTVGSVKPLLVLNTKRWQIPAKS